MTDASNNKPKKTLPGWISGDGQHWSPLVAEAMREVAAAHPDADYIDGDALQPVMLALYTTLVIENARVSSAEGHLPGCEDQSE